MQPGGKPEAGETPAQTALRETAEEIGLELQVEQLEPLGRFAAQAANEAEFSVVCDNFLVAIDDGVAAGLAPEAEIAELQWFALEDLSPCDDVAPLLTERVAPAVRQWLGLSTSPVVKG